LHGRETEIALIDGFLDRIDEGGSALIFSGAPGIGKSALVEEAKSRARERGIIVLSMTGVLAEVHLAYAGLERALRPLVKQAKSLAAHQQSALLNAFRISDEAAVSPDTWLVALATLTLLTEGTGHKPVLLVADDAQRLDEATREVLSFVSRRLSSDSIVLLLASSVGRCRHAAARHSCSCLTFHRCHPYVVIHRRGKRRHFAPRNHARRRSVVASAA
jgi:predicted ATPase